MWCLTIKFLNIHNLHALCWLLILSENIKKIGNFFISIYIWEDMKILLQQNASVEPALSEKL